MYSKQLLMDCGVVQDYPWWPGDGANPQDSAGWGPLRHPAIPEQGWALNRGSYPRGNIFMVF